MNSVESVTLEVPDPTVAGAFYTAAFGLGTQVGLRASQAPTTGAGEQPDRVRDSLAVPQ